MTVNGQRWDLEHGAQRASVVQRGGALQSYLVDGLDLVDGFADDERPPAFNGAVLAPWPNRIPNGRWTWRGRQHQLPISEPATGSALHGLVSDVLWQPEEVQADAVTLSVPIAPSAGYPFQLRVTVTWSLSAEGLRCRLGALNTGDEPAPFGVATHPFFRLPDARVDDLELQLPAGQWLETDSNLAPVALRQTSGTQWDFTEPRSLRGLRLDTAFTAVSPDFEATSRAVLSSQGAALTIWAEADFTWWQVYTSDYFEPGSDRLRRSLAVEAMTCAPDAFNSGADLIVLEPGVAWSGSWGAQARLG
ncbi:MAG TPA: aldose 1-epimerase family protein [Jatrophihabitans sp.]|jgi:aldose 1-epimerase|uniref:aldose 1-epimerase family protein n=1 Tax=Jatrophihabitans sp. TaxID=1932789 RepID=UPI002F1073F2